MFGERRAIRRAGAQSTSSPICCVPLYHLKGDAVKKRVLRVVGVLVVKKRAQKPEHKESVRQFLRAEGYRQILVKCRDTLPRSIEPGQRLFRLDPIRGTPFEVYL